MKHHIGILQGMLHRIHKYHNRGEWRAMQLELWYGIRSLVIGREIKQHGATIPAPVR